MNTNSQTLTLDIVICSTRPGRIGDKVARWFTDFASADGSFNARLTDIAAFDLPLLNESRHPRLGDYEHEHTKKWASSVAHADAFAFVAPEYNHGPPASLVNALSYLSAEWAFKPAGFVSYGGRSGGLRAVQLTKGILSALQMYPTRNGVVIPNVTQHIKDEDFQATEAMVKEAAGLLSELLLVAGAFRGIRKPGS